MLTQRPPFLSKPKLDRAGLRRLLLAMFPLSPEYEAFVQDCFPATAHQYTVNMDRTTQLNQLLERESLVEVFAALSQHCTERLLSCLPALDLPLSELSLRWLCELLTFCLTGYDDLAKQELAALLSQPLHGDRIGLFGMTSSGKSTLVNAFMRRGLLPTQLRATTIVPVVCQYGARESLVVEYQNDTADSADLPRPTECYVEEKVSPALVSKLCAQENNPDNEKRLARLIWTRAAMSDDNAEQPIPINSQMIDMPGPNAYDYSGFREQSEKPFLASCPLWIYAVGARQPIKDEDRGLLANAISQGCLVTFVVTKWDLETESLESSDELTALNIYRRQDKRERYVEQLSELWLRAVESVGGSATIAQQEPPHCFFIDSIAALDNLQNEEFGALCKHIKRLIKQLEISRQITFANSIISRVNSLTDSAFERPQEKGSDSIQKMRKREAERSIKAMEDLLSKVDPNSTNRHAMDKAICELKSLASLAALKRVLRHGKKGAEIIDGHRDLSFKISTLSTNYCANYNKFVKEIIDSLKSMGLQYQHSPYSVVTPVSPRDALHALIPKKKSPEGAWETVFNIFSDNTYVYADDALEKTNQNLLSLADNYQDYMDFQIHHNIKALEDKLGTMQNLLKRADEPLPTAGLHWRPSGILTVATCLMERLKKEHAGLAPDASILHVGAHTGTLVGWSTKPLRSGPQLLQGLAQRYREVDFGQRLATCVRAACGSQATGRAARLLLLGPRREQGITLLALLHRQLAQLGGDKAPWDERNSPTRADQFVAGPFVEGLPPGTKIVAGGADSAQDAAVWRELAIVSAPADQELRTSTFQTSLPELIAWADVVGVFFDAPRVSAGLLDFHLAPYRTAAQLQQKLLFLCSDGSLLGKGQAVVQNDVRPVLRTYAAWLAERPWFVFEDYEVLYADSSSVGRSP